MFKFYHRYFLVYFSSDYDDRVIAGDYWAVSENAVNDLLENDDPLAMEEFEMSWLLSLSSSIK